MVAFTSTAINLTRPRTEAQALQKVSAAADILPINAHGYPPWYAAKVPTQHEFQQDLSAPPTKF